MVAKSCFDVVLQHELDLWELVMARNLCDALECGLKLDAPFVRAVLVLWVEMMGYGGGGVANAPC